MKLHLAASLLALPLLAGALPALAQDYDRTQYGYGDSGGGDDRGSYDRGGSERSQADPQDSTGVELRVGKLEKRIREMTGQIEELQNANRQLIQQVQKFQQDVDSRLSSGGGRGKRAEASPPVAPDPSPSLAGDGAAKPVRKARRDDAYDPDAAPNSDSGRPKPLGSTASVEESGANAPMDLSGGKLRGNAGGDTLAPTLRLPSSKAAGGTLAPDGKPVATATPGSPRAAFDAALALYKGKQYEDAEKGFAAFVEKNPKSRLAADATYFLGETYAQRGRSSEAAEQYMKVIKDYGSSNRAPDAMLHLGISIRAMGSQYKEQACAAFSGVSQKYPNAPSYVKAGVERELKRAQCG